MSEVKIRTAEDTRTDIHENAEKTRRVIQDILYDLLHVKARLVILAPETLADQNKLWSTAINILRHVPLTSIAIHTCEDCGERVVKFLGTNSIFAINTHRYSKAKCPKTESLHA